MASECQWKRDENLLVFRIPMFLSDQTVNQALSTLDHSECPKIPDPYIKKAYLGGEWRMCLGLQSHMRGRSQVMVVPVSKKDTLHMDMPREKGRREMQPYNEIGTCTRRGKGWKEKGNETEKGRENWLFNGNEKCEIEPRRRICMLMS